MRLGKTKTSALLYISGKSFLLFFPKKVTSGYVDSNFDNKGPSPTTIFLPFNFKDKNASIFFSTAILPTYKYTKSLLGLRLAKGLKISVSTPLGQ